MVSFAENVFASLFTIRSVNRTSFEPDGVAATLTYPPNAYCVMPITPSPPGLVATRAADGAAGQRGDDELTGCGRSQRSNQVSISARISGV
jgi:hypothetical protein